MHIVVTYMIPVTVYVDTEEKRVTRVCVDDEASMDIETACLDGTEGGEDFEGFTPSIDIPEKAHRPLIEEHHEIMNNGEDWPAWRFGY